MTDRRRRLLLIGAGEEQIAAVRAAHELGLEVVGFDGNPRARGASFCDRFEVVDLRNRDALLTAARRVRPDAVFVHAAELAVETAQVAEALELPGLPVSTAMRATDKALRSASLSAAGVPVPAFARLESEESAETWYRKASALALPWVLKPTNQAGARGVRRCDHPEQLVAYHAERGGVRAPAYVVEELIEGPQLSTESVIVDGVVAHTAVALRHYDTTADLLPCIIEDGHSMPVGLSPATAAAVDRVIAASFAALGIRNGVLKGDLVVRGPEDVVVLEMACRTSGGRFADTVVPLATGVDILYPLLLLALGETPGRHWFESTRSVGVSQRFILRPPGQRVARWPAFSRAFRRPGIAAWWLNDAVLASATTPVVRCHGDRIGYAIGCAATREAADALVREAIDGLEWCDD